MYLYLKQLYALSGIIFLLHIYIKEYKHRVKIVMLSKEYISGFCDADGGFHKTHVTITNTDIEHLKEINRSLNEYGIKTYMFVKNNTNPKHSPQIGRIQISGFKNLLIFATEIGFKFKRKQDGLISCLLTQMAEGKRYNLKEHNEIVDLRNKGLSYRKIEEHFNYRIPFITIAQRFNRNGMWPLDKRIVERINVMT